MAAARGTAPSAPARARRSFATLLNDIASQVADVLTPAFKKWWLSVREPKKPEVAAHLVNLAWNGLSHLETKPVLVPQGRHPAP